ncbi:MAG: hypothetical protein AAF697_14075 [Pseudomonadota bacterium]
MSAGVFTLCADLALGKGFDFLLESAGKADVIIQEGAVPDRLNCVPFDEGFYVYGRQVLVQIDADHAFLIEDGARITYRPGPNARAFLTGTIFAIICFQRGLIPLHASAVTSNGDVHAFTGPPGSGKSTMAMALGRAGMDFFTDDVLVVEPADSSELKCYALQRQAKLWPDSLANLDAGSQGEAYRRFGAIKHLAGYSEDNGNGVAAQGVLRSLALVNGGATARPSIHALEGSEALRMVTASVYRPQFGVEIFGLAEFFGAITQVAQSIDAERLNRPTDWDQLAEFCAQFVSRIRQGQTSLGVCKKDPFCNRNSA